MSTPLVQTKLLLSSTNYTVWTTMIMAKLDNLQALDVVEETGKLNEDQILLNRKAANLIIRYLDVENLGLISNLLTREEQRDGWKLWLFLKSKYEADDSFSQIYSFAKFSSVKFEETTTFVREIRDAVSHMRRVGFILEDKPLAIMILSKLPMRLEGFMRMTVHGTLDSVEGMLTKLEQEHKFFSIAQEEQLPDMNALHLAKRPQGCNHCGSPRHYIEAFWKLHPELIPPGHSMKSASDQTSKSAHFIDANLYFTQHQTVEAKAAHEAQLNLTNQISQDSDYPISF